MSDPDKACPFVLRHAAHGPEVLAFRHPSAGKQFVKGTIESGEDALGAAQRELFEESGLWAGRAMAYLGQSKIGTSQIWAFYVAMSEGLPNTWQHQTADDHGHVFDFFWHPLITSPDTDWDPIFDEAHDFLVNRISEINMDDISYLSGKTGAHSGNP